MNFYKTSLLTAASTAISLLSGFVSLKLVAVNIGPDGIAVFSKYQNIIAVLTVFSTLSLQSCTIKYVAQHRGDGTKGNDIFIAILKIATVASLLLGLGLVAGSRYWAQLVFSDASLYYLFILLGGTLGLNATASLLMGYYNGLGDIKTMTIANIVGPLLSTTNICLMTLAFGVKGVLVAQSTSFVLLFATHVILLRTRRIPVLYRGWKENQINIRDYLKSFVGFSVTSIITGILPPTTQYIIREAIIRKNSLDTAGQWQAVAKISDYYLLFFSMVIGVYFFPKMAGLKGVQAIGAEIKRGLTVIIPTVVLISATIYLLRDYVIAILFSKQFTSMSIFFKYQLIGDIFKITSWIFTYLMIAKNLLFEFISIEVLFSAFLIIFSLFCVGRMGAVGATFAFMVSYALYLMTVVCFYRLKTVKILASQ